MPACMSMYPWRIGKGSGSTGTRVKNNWEAPRGCWKSELKLGSLEEQPVFLPESSLQSPEQFLQLWFYYFVQFNYPKVLWLVWSHGTGKDNWTGHPIGLWRRGHHVWNWHADVITVLLSSPKTRAFQNTVSLKVNSPPIQSHYMKWWLSLWAFSSHKH